MSILKEWWVDDLVEIIIRLFTYKPPAVDREAIDREIDELLELEYAEAYIDPPTR